MSRPVLKGVLHALATICYIMLIPIIADCIPVGLEIPLYCYIMAVIAHLGSSAVLHLIPWQSHRLLYMRRLDHLMIFTKIAATYYAVIVTVMPDINSIVIYILIFGTLLGIAIRMFFTDIHVALISLPYVLIGWAFLLDTDIFLLLLERIPVGTFVGLSGGICYTVGAMIYAMKYPNPWPKYLGFHEVFHIFTTMGTILFTLSIFQFAVPFYLSTTSKEICLMPE